MGTIMGDIEIPSKYSDRKVKVRALTDGDDYGTFYITHTGFFPQANRTQFAHIGKDELLNALARIGWLPDEYLKPEPIDPREAKIRQVTLAIYNDDATHDGFLVPYDTYEEFALELPDSVDDYRRNAVALIDAGLVKVDEE